MISQHEVLIFWNMPRFVFTFYQTECLWMPVVCIQCLLHLPSCIRYDEWWGKRTNLAYISQELSVWIHWPWEASHFPLKVCSWLYIYLHCCFIKIPPHTHYKLKVNERRVYLVCNYCIHQVSIHISIFWWYYYYWGFSNMYILIVLFFHTFCTWS